MATEIYQCLLQFSFSFFSKFPESHSALSRMKQFSSVTFSCSLCSCPNSGCGRGRRRAVLLLLLGCHVFPISAPLDPAFLSRLWQESNSLRSRSFSTIQLFSWARALNFSCRKSLVLSCNKFWVRWSLKRSKITQKRNQLKAKHKVHQSFLF